MRFSGYFSALLLVFLFASAPVCAGEPVALIGVNNPGDGWSFDYGAEFPGATGSLSVDAEAAREGHPSLKLIGDFDKGGNYVQAGRKIAGGVDIRDLSMWIRTDADSLTIRLNDASGQTHQIKVKTEAGPEWQQIVLPLERFFANRGRADAVASIAKYESWGGAKDGAWHGPASAIYILLGKPPERKRSTLWLNDIVIAPRPAEPRGIEVKSSLRLDDIVEGAHDWRFSLGEEFKGAKGTFDVIKDEPNAGETCLRLTGDFTGGGEYVAAIKKLKDLAVKDIPAIHLRIKSENAALIGIQLVDSSGQTHQQSHTKITADGTWHALTIDPRKIAGGEHWGGANDGKWHAPAAQFSISVSSASDPKTRRPSIDLAEVRADVVQTAIARPAAFKSDFKDAALPGGWVASDGVSVESNATARGGNALKLSRSLENIQQPCTVNSPSFNVLPGQWEIEAACKSQLHSPDNSYNAVVQLQCLDGSSKILERITVVEMFGTHDWQPTKKRVEIPKNAVSARFVIQLNKVDGSFWIDALSAAYLSPAQSSDERIARLLFSTAQLGNLLLPTDARLFTVTVEANKPLRDGQHTLSYVVRDYWGAEQMLPMTAVLGHSEKKGDVFSYRAEIDLSSVALEIGRYYELHASLPRDSGEPFRNYTSFAILPEAETKRFKPEEIPFTSRNWDNRLTEYVKLSDRLGLRVCGVWGTWSSKPPYMAEAPSLDLVQQLGMGWLTNTPCALIEQGNKTYDEAALRQGVRNLIEHFGKVRPMVINLGNEPHGTGARVLANVEAYRVVYDEIKKVDSTIPVVATSVEPNEEYFKAGYGKWCDAFDFHIYESAEDVRRTMAEYRVLMQKYGVVKPLWSTELGLNSQGLTRHAVAVEVIKKFATFFAAGGANASWFGLLYPDGDGKSHGSSGDSHNVFDCRYNRYCPRLDAIAYYNSVNAIAIKKVVDEKQYADGTRAVLFRDRDDRTLQILWKEKGTRDAFVPLPAVTDVQVIRIDGSRRMLSAGGKGITLSITEDPLLLLYSGGPKTLAATLEVPFATLGLNAPKTLARGAETTLTVTGGAVELIAPPFWTVHKETAPAPDGKPATRFTVMPPKDSAVREADLIFTMTDAGGRIAGELYYRFPLP